MHAGLCPYGKDLIPEHECQLGGRAHGAGPEGDAECLNIRGRLAILFLMAGFQSRTKFPM